MAEQPSRKKNNTITIIVVLVLIIIAILLLLSQCQTPKAAQPASTSSSPPASQPTSAPVPQPSTPQPATELPKETLGAVRLLIPDAVLAGSTFNVAWTGPDNRGDFLTIVKADAPATSTTSYQDVQQGKPSENASFPQGRVVELTAPIDPGPYEIRYVTGQSKTVLARTPIEVTHAGATVDAPAEVTLGSKFQVAWTGPGNKGDFITIIEHGAADDKYGDYATIDQGSPVSITAPPQVGAMEVRYVTGQGRKVLGRRPINVMAAVVTITAPDSAIAGSLLDVTWTGPNNAGDYITIVPIATPDGQYANYTNTATGSPLKLLLPIMEGQAELRYMTGQGRQVLARRPIKITAPQIVLSAAPDCAPGSDVSITWTGPNHPGDYITIVPNTMPDGQYRAYTNTTKGSPLTVKAPAEVGEAEIRYASGQGNKVLARIPIRVK